MWMLLRRRRDFRARAGKREEDSNGHFVPAEREEEDLHGRLASAGNAEELVRIPSSRRATRSHQESTLPPSQGPDLTVEGGDHD